MSFSTLLELECQHCKHPFQPTNKRQRFCSAKCRAAASYLPILQVNQERKKKLYAAGRKYKTLEFDGRSGGSNNTAYFDSPVCCTSNAKAPVNVRHCATTNVQTGQQVNHWQHGSGVIVEFINLEVIHVRFESDARVRTLCASNLTDINKRPLIKLHATVY
jgi:hypothetical protein